MRDAGSIGTFCVGEQNRRGYVKKGKVTAYLLFASPL
jgi:hypothetical protein